MQNFGNLRVQAEAFINSNEFFHYHGLVLAVLWFFASPIGILLCKISRTLHALAYFLIDVTSIFFIGGALFRVYPHLNYFVEWSLIKQGHIATGAIFIVLLVIQHFGGVVTLLTKMPHNPVHRKFGVVVTNMGRAIAIFGMVLAKKQQWLIYSSTGLALILLVVSVQKGFFAKENLSKKVESKASEASRQRSPPRDVKRD